MLDYYVITSVKGNYTNPTNNCIKHLSFGQEKKKKRLYNFEKP